MPRGHAPLRRLRVAANHPRDPSVFYPVFAVVVVGTLTAGLRGGASRAAAVGWVGAAFLLPFWLQVGLGTMFLDLRTGAALAVVVVALASPPAGALRPTFADALVLAVVLVQVVAQHQAGLLRPLTVPEIARKWLAPYLMGRLLLGSPADVGGAVRGFARVIAGLSAYAVFECFTKVNPVNLALGRSFGLLEAGEG